MGDWAAVENEIDRVVRASDKRFAPETIGNVREFISFVRSYCPVPKITKGYWETIILSWEIQPKGFEVEVFGDRLELYRFDDRRTDIKNVAHRAGEAFPTTL